MLIKPEIIKGIKPLFFEDGKLAGKGGYHELIKTNSKFKDLTEKSLERT